MWMSILGLALAQEIPEEEELPGDFEGLPEEAPEPAWEPSFQLSAGPGLGATMHLRAGLSAAAQLSVDVGAQLPVWGGRLRPLALLSYAAPTASGSGEDPRMPSPYTYTLQQREISLAAGLGVRALSGSYPVNPEFIVAPQVMFAHSSLTSTMESTPLGTAQEVTRHFGWIVAPGFVVRAGPGELALRLALSNAPIDGQITGEVSGLATSPSVTYRIHIGGRP